MNRAHLYLIISRCSYSWNAKDEASQEKQHKDVSVTSHALVLSNRVDQFSEVNLLLATSALWRRARRAGQIFLVGFHDVLVEHRAHPGIAFFGQVHVVALA